MDIHYWMIRNL